MGLTFIGATRGDQASSATVAASPHTSTAAGDIVFALSWIYGTSTFTSIVSDFGSWNELGFHTLSSAKQRLYWMICPEGGIGSTTVTYSAVAKNSLLLVTYKASFNPLDPIDQFSNTEYVVADTTVRAAGFTVGTNDPVIFFATNNYNVNCTFTPPTGMAEDYDGLNGNSKAAFGVASVAHTGGATGNMDSVATEVAWSGRKHAFAVSLNRLWRKVTGNTVQSSTVVDIEFDAAVDQTTGEDETKWTITKDGGGAVPTFTCTRQVDTSVVQIVFDTPLSGVYTVEATAVLDSDGYALDSANDSTSVAVLPAGGSGRHTVWVF